MTPVHLLSTKVATVPLLLSTSTGTEPTGTDPRNTCTTLPLGSRGRPLVLFLVHMDVMTPELIGLLVYLLNADYLLSGRVPLLLLSAMMVMVVTLWSDALILMAHLLVLIR